MILIVSLVSAALAGCGVADEKTREISETSAAGAASEASDLPVNPLGFQRENNNGKKFTLLATTDKSYEYDAEELSGEIVSDSVYEKNMEVEDYLGIELNIRYENDSWTAREAFNNLIQDDVLSGSGEYDLVSAVISCTMPLITTGCFTDQSTLEYVDFSNPWWVENMLERFGVDGKLYCSIGDGSLSIYKDITVLLFNKRIWNDFKAPDPYELVRGGEWTLDKFLETCSGMTLDLNGDGKCEFETDQLTYVGERVPNGTWQTALDLRLLTNDGGEIKFTGLTEKHESAFRKVYNFFKQEGVAAVNTVYVNTNESLTQFSGGNIATLCSFIYSTEYLRDMKDDFGIIPQPKYDANQENYISQLGTSSAIYFVPKTAKDLGLTSKVMEAMSYYTHELVVPKYYEIALKDKYTRDDDVREMLDIVRKGATLDFLYIYAIPLGGIFNVPFVINDKVTTPDSIASFFESNTARFEKILSEFLESYRDQ